jgi:hypothetical protein
MHVFTLLKCRLFHFLCHHFGLLTSNSLLVLDLLEPVKFFSFQFIQLSDYISQGLLNAWNDNCREI